MAKAARRRGGREIVVVSWDKILYPLHPDHAPLGVLREVTSVELALLAARFVYV